MKGTTHPNTKYYPLITIQESELKKHNANPCKKNSFKIKKLFKKKFVSKSQMIQSVLKLHNLRLYPHTKCFESRSNSN